MPIPRSHPPTAGEPGAGRDRWCLRVQTAQRHGYGRQGAKDGAAEGHFLRQGAGGRAIWGVVKLVNHGDLIVIYCNRNSWDL